MTSKKKTENGTKLVAIRIPVEMAEDLNKLAPSVKEYLKKSGIETSEVTFSDILRLLINLGVMALKELGDGKKISSSRRFQVHKDRQNLRSL